MEQINDEEVTTDEDEEMSGEGEEEECDDEMNG